MNENLSQKEAEDVAFQAINPNVENQIECCGFCGRFFRGKEYLSDSELATLKRDKDVNFFVLYDHDGKQIELGYCPEVNAEAQYEQLIGYLLSLINVHIVTVYKLKAKIWKTQPIKTKRPNENSIKIFTTQRGIRPSQSSASKKRSGCGKNLPIMKTSAILTRPTPRDLRSG